MYRNISQYSEKISQYIAIRFSCIVTPLLYIGLFWRQEILADLLLERHGKFWRFLNWRTSTLFAKIIMHQYNYTAISQIALATI